MNEIVKVLMERDGDSLEEARERLEEARSLVECGQDPEEVLAEEFELEPDYIFDLI